MDIETLRKTLAQPKLFGATAIGKFDQSRSVIVQVFRGYDEEFGLPIYEYHGIRSVGVLFHDGEFKVVIAVGEDDE